MTDCAECKADGLVYVMSRECCKARWLSTCFKPHGDAMLDRWQKQDALMLGEKKAKARRTELIAMSKKMKAEREKFNGAASSNV